MFDKIKDYLETRKAMKVGKSIAAWLNSNPDATIEDLRKVIISNGFESVALSMDGTQEVFMNGQKQIVLEYKMDT